MAQGRRRCKQGRLSARVGVRMRGQIIHKKQMGILLLILVLQVIAALCFCGQKTGFHYDEYYSYYSSNVTYGLVPTDREWKDGGEIRSEFEVREGERFHYPMVVQMQTYDVHPPFYYLLLHTACSLCAGSFSKWPALLLNLFCFIGSFILLAGLAWRVSLGKWRVVIGSCLLFGCSPAVMSGIVMARMYFLLTFLALLAAWLHTGVIRREETWSAACGAGGKEAGAGGLAAAGGREAEAGGLAAAAGTAGRKLSFLHFYLPVMATVYLGFLTHYYYVVFLFFLASGMEWYLFTRGWGQKGIWKKNLRQCIGYGCSVAAALLLAVISYPACLGHIFRGYRGTEAMGEFFNAANTAGRIRFFAGLLNEYVFGMLLPVLLLFAVVLLLWLQGKRRWQRRTGTKPSGGWCRTHAAFLLMAWTGAGYFLVVAKTALLNAEEANRYQLPIYGFLLLVMVTGLDLLLTAVWKEKKAVLAGTAVLGMICLGQIWGLTHGKVLFLYPEDESSAAFAREHRSEAVVYYYNPNLQWMIWDDSLELMQYDEIYFVSLADTSPLQDAKLAQADRIWVYAARAENTDEALRSVQEANPMLGEARKVRELLYCDLYELDQNELDQNQLQ